jgi:hypothetical protein
MPVYMNGNDQVWYTWNTSSTTATSNVVWASWNNTTTTGMMFNAAPRDHVEPPSEEDLRRLEESRQRRAAERAERDRGWTEAEKRADELLHELLDDQQWAAWLKDHHFDVDGSDGGHYQIRKGHAGNVSQLDDQGRRVASLCIHPNMNTDQGRLPETDAVIAQLLTLRTDEAEFRRIANITNYELAA